MVSVGPVSPSLPVAIRAAAPTKMTSITPTNTPRIPTPALPSAMVNPQVPFAADQFAICHKVPHSSAIFSVASSSTTQIGSEAAYPWGPSGCKRPEPLSLPMRLVAARKTLEGNMRPGTIAVGFGLLLSAVVPLKASPLMPISRANVVNDSIVQVRGGKHHGWNRGHHYGWYKHHRHNGWKRGHHYGWYKSSHHRWYQSNWQRPHYYWR
jgi:hypothetical protein